MMHILEVAIELFAVIALLYATSRLAYAELFLYKEEFSADRKQSVAIDTIRGHLTSFGFNYLKCRTVENGIIIRAEMSYGHKVAVIGEVARIIAVPNRDTVTILPGPASNGAYRNYENTDDGVKLLISDLRKGCIALNTCEHNSELATV
jgi:hypothetical protein